MMANPNFSAGDPVVVIKPTLEGEIKIPATVVFVNDYAIGVAYADGKREVLDKQYVMNARLFDRI